MNKKFLFSGVLTLLVSSSLNAQELSGDARHWYDIDGDGLLETISGSFSDSYVYSINSSGEIVKKAKIQCDQTISKVYFSRLSSSSPLFAFSESKYGSSELFWINADFSASMISLRDSKLIYPADYDNSGRKGLISKGTLAEGIDGHSWRLAEDNSFVEDRFPILSWNEYNNLRSELTLSYGVGIGSGMSVVRPTPGIHLGGLSMLDVNGDGLADMIDGSRGLFYLNTGLGSYVENSFSGQTEIRDLNGDGLADMVSYDSTEKTVTVYLTRYGAQHLEKVLLSGYPVGSKIWCFDFDRDGDVDILVPINNERSDSDAFLVFYENDGKGSFKQHDSVIEGTVKFHECMDIDADGFYEVIATDPSGGESYLKSYKIEGAQISGEMPTVYQIEKKGEFAGIGDYMHNGKTGVMLGNGNYYTLSTRTNTRPSAPEQPVLIFFPESNFLKVNWKAASDVETPTVDLTYEIRIGTQPGLDDIAAVDALSDGRRRNMLQGANGHLTYRTFDVSTWPSGKYYISVQTVDGNMCGSVFSQYAVFEKAEPTADFTIELADNAGPGEKVTVRVKNSEPGVTYQWELADATVIETAPDGSSCTFTYAIGGNKNLRLTASLNGKSASESRSIDIKPVNSTRLWDSTYTTNLVADLDADGSEEYYDGGKFYEQDKDGNSKTISKLWNTNPELIQYHEPYIFDANHDGLVDIFWEWSNNYVMMTNEHDKNMTFSEPIQSDIHENLSMIIYDLDNDGNAEFIYEDGKYTYFFANLQGEDLVPVSDCNIPSSIFNSFKYGEHRFDFNGDGFLDIAYESNVYLNNGDLTFTESDIKIENKYQWFDRLTFADIDFDGKPDYIVNGAKSAFGVTTFEEYIEIYFGNGRHMTIQCPDGKPFYMTGMIFDLDNNGMQDIQFGDTVLHFNPDYSYDFFFGNFNDYHQGVIHRNDGAYLCADNVFTGVTNTRPSAPTQIRATIDGDFVNLEWNPADDVETPSAGLRYNVSVKHKGVEGDGAYILSPMNLDRDYVNVPTGHQLYSAPRIKIPLRALASGDYEVRIQAVDGFYETGKFSEPYTFTVTDYAKLEMPTSAMVSNPVAVKVKTNKTIKTVDFGEGAEYTLDSNNQYTVTWSTTGLKEISVNEVKLGSIYVYPEIDASFELPESVLAGARMEITCPTASLGRWETVDNSGVVATLFESPCVSSAGVNDQTLGFTVNSERNFTLRHIIEETYGEVTAEATLNISNVNSAPQIKLTSVNDGKFTIMWDASSLPAQTERINVYRETSRANVYELIGSAESSAGVFVDESSRPDVKTERYQLRSVLPYGESAGSVTHQPMHLLLNRSLNDAINLMWSRYEGLNIETYNIYSGSDKDNLTFETSVSGNKTSYVSTEPKEFYAVEIIAPSGRVSRSVDVASSRSNVVASANAHKAMLASAIEIVAMGGSNVIDLAQSNTLELCARILPAGTTFNDVDWAITEGTNIATIDSYGHLKASRIGKVVVEASTRDGSGISNSFEVNVEFHDIPFTFLEIYGEKSETITVGGTLQLRAQYEPENATDTPVWESLDPSVATVSDEGLVTGISEGEVDILVKSALTGEDFDYKFIIVRGVKVPVTSVELSPKEIEGKPDDIVRVTAKVLPENATEKTVHWEIEQDNIVIESIEESDTAIEIKLRTPGTAFLGAYALNGEELTACDWIMITVSEDDTLTELTGGQNTFDVFTPQGLLIVSGATVADLNNLQPGIYLLRNGATCIKHVKR